MRNSVTASIELMSIGLFVAAALCWLGVLSGAI